MTSVIKPIALLPLALLAACASSAPGDTARVEKDLVALHDDWGAASIKGDTAFLEKFYGQELRLVVVNGSVVGRNDDIAMFQQVGRGDPNAIKPEYIKDTDMKVSVYGETAVVTGVENVRGTYRGVFSEAAVRFTNVLVRRDGRWQLVSGQGTPVQAK